MSHGARRVAGLAAAAALTALLGCAGPSPADHPRGAPPAAAGPSPADSAAGAGPDSSGPSRPVTLAFAGDVHFERRLARLLDSPAQSLASLRATLGAADFAMVNLETSITEAGTRVAKAFTFRAPPTAIDAVVGAGADAASMANNHAVDFGPSGFRDTLDAKTASPIPIVGIGRDAAEAFTPAVVDVAGLKVALLSSTQTVEETTARFSADDDSPGVAANLDLTRLRDAVRAAVADHDLVVVMMHWGTEGSTCVDERQQRTARALANEGADLVVGAHAHRLQGSGWLGKTYVAWGLGNFVFYRDDEPSSRSGVLTVTVDAAAAMSRRNATKQEREGLPSVVTAARWTPMLIGSDGVPREPAAAGARQRLMRVWDQAVSCSGLSTTPGVGLP